MIGLILCGGKSSRMGTDKGLLTDTGTSWAETAQLKLAPFVHPIFISVNPEQYIPYQKHFTSHQLIVDNHTLNMGGPLCGLLSAHLLFPDEDIYLLACDLLFMESKVFEQLLLQKNTFPIYDAYLFSNQQSVEPLCGIYSSKALKLVYRKHTEGSLGKQSMKHILENLNPLKTELPDGWNSYFKNINSRCDLNS